MEFPAARLRAEASQSVRRAARAGVKSAVRCSPAAVGATHGADYGGVATPMRLTTDVGVLSFISTVTVFGTPVDVTVSELALETFFPADEFTAQALISLAAKRAEATSTAAA